jgi:ABC-type multidrug transport system fused ATPase/permease subunit
MIEFKSAENKVSGEDATDRSGALPKAIKSLGLHLSAAQKKRMYAQMVLIFISAILDVFGLASILPIVKLAGEPAVIHKQPVLEWLYVHLNFSTEKGFLLFLMIGVLVFFVLKSAFGIFVNWLQVRFAGGVAIHITQQQFKKYFNLDFHRFTSLKSSVVTHHIINNPVSYVTWVVLPLMLIMSEAIIILLIVCGIAYYDFKLFLFIVCLIGPASWVIFALLKNRSTRIGREMNRIYPLALGTLTQTISGYIDIILAEKTRFYEKRFLRQQGHFQRLSMMAYLQNLIPIRANELVALSGMVLIFIYAIFLTDNQGSAVVMVSLFAAAAYRLMPSITRILNSMVYIRKNMAAIENLSLYREETPEKKVLVEQKELAFNSSIELNNIYYRFPGKEKYVLDNIDITIKKGEKIGIVGSSGSGKTTLMNVLLRFYTEEKGGIYIDGRKLGPEHLHAWRSRIGYVKQDIFLLDASIRENIAFGEDAADEARLITAVQQASLQPLIDSLPEGLETQIGERGSRLSGGQRQRISIARSLYRNAEILIFDEATSALDTQTEQEVTDSIDSLSEVNKTIFIIAHRVTTLKNCDRIYELQDGKVNGIWSYSELIEKVI